MVRGKLRKGDGEVILEEEEKENRKEAMTIQLKSRNKVTLPQEVVDQLGVKSGDDFLFEVRDGRLTLIPAMTVPRDEAYLFTPEWQERIHEAEDDIRSGRVYEAASAEEMIRKLNEATR